MGPEVSEREIAKIIKKALELIEGGWSRENTAMTKGGKVCRYDAEEAKQFSLAGALHRAQHELKISPKQHADAVEFLNAKLGGSVVRFNSSATSGQVVCERVAEILKARIVSRQKKPEEHQQHMAAK